MTRTILNVGAGYLPLVPADFESGGVSRVVNLDPLDLRDALSVKFLLVVKEIPEILYFRTQAEADRSLLDDSVDLLLTVSPYGFSAIDDWATGKLRSLGYALVLGNTRNKFIAEEAGKLFSSEEVRSRYRKPVQEPEWVQRVIQTVLLQYTSRTSKAEHETKLDRRFLLQRV